MSERANQPIPTANRMGWTTSELNRVSRAFSIFASSCQQPVLDIGAGYGICTIASLRAGATVIANDIEASHLQALLSATPREYRSRLTLLEARFPDQLTIAEESIGAVHASNVLHFLTGSEIETGLRKAFCWLVPAGKLFVQMSSPYVANLLPLIPQFESKKAAGIRWPGEFEDVQSASRHPSTRNLPPFLNVVDADILRDAVRDAGFVVEDSFHYRRAGLPTDLEFDGRENVGLVAKKPL